MAKWSPQLALDAYLRTLQLCKTKTTSSQKVCETITEPKCMEFISALAAGNRARVIMEITSEGLTALTMALAVAAKHTGGHLLCIVLHNHDQDSHQRQHSNFIPTELEDVIELVYGYPYEVMIQCKNIDFLVVDGKLEDQLNLFQMIDLNPKGSVIVRHNLAYSEKRSGLSQVWKGSYNTVDSVTLPMGEGMELTKVGSMKKLQNRRYKRFHVTYE
ncbi:hypothetical protein K2173_007179 [Erythroxylum novogranatense]|uniref:Uncharacterized protein n=1 Tax=Erythroxylum novogranatense TaxID=1862640 RepID=A0AAV8SZX4_9ROSI|nr:hypothetical protein K2173_007179 [Erythroxylum novogranatense]